MQAGLDKRIAAALVLLLALSSCRGLSTSGPGERVDTSFADIYGMIGRADGMLEKEEYRSALELYQGALIEMDQFSDTNPKWKTEYVAYKRKECVEKLERTVSRLGPREQSMLEARKVYVQAVGDLREDDTRAAVEKIKRALEIYPDYFDAEWMLGNAYERLGETELAIASYRRAEKLDPSSALPHQSLGELYERKEKYTEALEEFKKAIESSPDEIAPYIYSSWVYINMDELDEALGVSRKALEVDPHNKVVLNNIGLIYQKMEEFDKAEAAYKKAILEDYTYISPYQNLGLVYAIQGRYAESIDQYKQVIEIDPRNAAAYYNIGINYKRLRKKLLSRYYLEQAAKLYGYETEDGKRSLEKIEELDSMEVDRVFSGVNGLSR